MFANLAKNKYFLLFFHKIVEFIVLIQNNLFFFYFKECIFILDHFNLYLGEKKFNI